jgi:hypothetical protein
MTARTAKHLGLGALTAALIVFSALSPAAFAAVQAVVTAELDAPLLPYHRSATLLLRAECSKGSAVQWPELSGKIESLEITADPPVVAEQPDGSLHAERAYHIDAVKPGSYRLPDMDVSVTAGAETASFPLPPLVFCARELTEEEKAAAANFEESAPLSAVESERAVGVYWILGSLLAAAAVAGILWKLFWRKKPLPSAQPKPAWDVALARLHELRLRNLPIQGQTERYYVDLSAILRYYVEDRFGLRAPEQTTPEFLDAAAQSGLLSDDQQNFLALFLRHSDRVKFARHEPSVVEMEERLAEAEQFVQDTVPSPVEAKVLEGAA